MPKPYVYQEYPKRVWHPETGRWKDVKSAEDVPEGWLDRHPHDPVHALGEGDMPEAMKPPEGNDGGVPIPQLTSEDRTVIIDELRSRRIPFNARASTPALAALLREAYAREA